jgi:hypothetical protein
MESEQQVQKIHRYKMYHYEMHWCRKDCTELPELVHSKTGPGALVNRNIHLSSMTEIRTPKDLFELGEFQTVGPTRLNHNHILNELRDNYNIYIPRKGE